MDLGNSLIVYRNLAEALAIGLLIGLERGWQQRETGPGERVAGLRTFAVIGLAGGVIGLLTIHTNATVLGLSFVALSLVLVVAHILSVQSGHPYGITSEISAVVTFGLGALSVLGAPYVAAVAGIVMAIILGLKPELHRWLARLDRAELIAALELLMISVVVLPLLPNYGLGPWHALNPYQIWFLVVVVAAISFIGHFSVRIFGQQRGILLTGFLGGLASSTGLTLHFARLARRTDRINGVLGTGIVIANTVSIPRILVITLFIDPALTREASLQLGTLTVIAAVVSLAVWWRLGRHAMRAPRRLGAPFQMVETLRFALLVVVVTLISAAANHWLGDWSIYGVALIAGAGNLTAVALSIATLAQGTLSFDTAVHALTIAVIGSLLFKGVIAYKLGNTQLGRVVLIPISVITVSAVLILFFVPLTSLYLSR